MVDGRGGQDAEEPVIGVNPGYASFQLAKAISALEEHPDPAVRMRAAERVRRWTAVLENVESGAIAYGSRAPLKGVPAWATPEVVTGGFATGALSAGGPLREHERRMMAAPGMAPSGLERWVLNTRCLAEEGYGELKERLRTGCYDVTVPEEGALLVVVWLMENGYVEEGHQVLEKIEPFFPHLRFYPVPRQEARRVGSRVHLETVGGVVNSLRRIGPHAGVVAQKRSVDIWLPLHDRVVALFMETVRDDWPCQVYPDDWSQRALALLGEYAELCREHSPPQRVARTRGHAAQLRGYLGQCARRPEDLTGRDVGQIRHILKCFIDKRGAPGSARCKELRRRQAEDVCHPLHSEIARVVAVRLQAHVRDEGLEDVDPVLVAVSDEEAVRFEVAPGTSLPPSVERKVKRCLSDTVSVLVERGIITSGDALAECLPQLTSGVRALGIADPVLRRLYAAVYRAFRRRRSLLLLNLDKQVQIEELPWIAAVEPHRSSGLSSQDAARQVLEEITILTLTSFPQAILPNKLIQEMRALARDSGLDLVLLEELAADIFMGRFSEKYMKAARHAAGYLGDSLYAAYYGIDYDVLRQGASVSGRQRLARLLSPKRLPDNPLAELCAARAGVQLGTWHPATNGMIIEQQQILTTQNLASLFAALDLAEVLQDDLVPMAMTCFSWVCSRHQRRLRDWRTRLKVRKNTAYAWRQMVFYLALLPASRVRGFLQWAESHLGEQEEGFRTGFEPVLRGLALAAEGTFLDDSTLNRSGVRRLVGWTQEHDWLPGVDTG